jgi:hypothetical protein
MYSNKKNIKKNFKPHMMYKNNISIMAKTYQDHLNLQFL